VTESEWARMCAEMVLRWPSQQATVTPQWIALWYPDVHQFSGEEMREALNLCVMSEPQWMPNGGQLAEAARNIRARLANSDEELERRREEKLRVDQRHAWLDYESRLSQGVTNLLPPGFDRPKAGQSQIEG